MQILDDLQEVLNGSTYDSQASIYGLISDFVCPACALTHEEAPVSSCIYPLASKEKELEPVPWIS